MFFGFISVDLKRQKYSIAFLFFCFAVLWRRFKGMEHLASRQRSYWILGSSISMGWMRCLMKQFNAAKRRGFSSSCLAQYHGFSLFRPTLRQVKTLILLSQPYWSICDNKFLINRTVSLNITFGVVFSIAISSVFGSDYRKCF